MIVNEWLTASLILLAVWAAIFIAKKNVRREMLWTSLLTMPLGLTEPLFVPSYWSPPSLFNLASRTGFDIESLIFSFAIGGVAAVLYETFVKVKHQRSKKKVHIAALLSPIVAFILLELFTKWNSIYTASTALFAGGITTMAHRPDLAKKSLLGGLLFTILYFAFFLTTLLIYPNFVQYWNLNAISGILILQVPLEELIFAFTFGMMWSGIYEHMLNYRIREVQSQW